MLAFVEIYALRRKIFTNGASGERRQSVHELAIAEVDEDFLQHAPIHNDAVNGQCINPFIRKKAA